MVDDDGTYRWWDNPTVAVDPTDSTGNTAYVASAEIWQTTNGAPANLPSWQSWSNVTSSGVYGAPFQLRDGDFPFVHAFTFVPHSSSFYIGSEFGAGMGISTRYPPPSTFNSVSVGATLLDTNLNITRFYGGSVGDVGGHAQFFGGTPSFGELLNPVYPGSTLPLWQPGQWNGVDGEDAGATVVDYTDNAIIYEEGPYGGIHKATDGGTLWNPATTGIDATDSVNYIMPFMMSHSNHLELLAGTDRVYRTTDGAASWSAVSPVLAPGSCGNSTCGTPLSTVVVAPNNDSYIYAGDNNGNIYTTINGGVSWNRAMTSSSKMPVTSLASDPANPQIVYATFAGFAGNAGSHVLKSTNAGGSWTDISTSLPDAPFMSVVVDPANPNLVIAGSDVGVFATSDAGSTWSQLGTGLPNVYISQVFTNHTGSRIFVATYGRGVWELDYPHIQVTPAAVSLTTAPNFSPNPQTLQLSNSGTAPLNWTADSLPSWVTVSPTSGSLASGASQPLTLTFNTASATPQTRSTTLMIADPNADNSPLSIPISVVPGQPSKTWYFAEGYTGGSFTEYLTLANPNPTQANVTITYYLDTGTTRQVPVTILPNQRYTELVNNDVGSGSHGHAVSTAITADQPIVAERPMYFTYTALSGYTIPGGSDVLGATQLGTTFDFGYLDTTAGHDTWLTMLNQNAAAMTATAQYFPASGGAPITRTHSVAAQSRGTIRVRDEGLTPGSYSALVHLSAPGLVERPLYLQDATTGYMGSADMVGVPSPQNTWYFAEGYTSSTFSERYIVSNPDLVNTASVTLTYYKADGTTALDTTTLAPGQQHMFVASATLGSGGVNNSAKVVATGAPVLAERFTSFKYTGPVGTCSSMCGAIPGASDVLGATAPSHLFYFAEGYSGGKFGEWLTVENPNTSGAAMVIVTFLPDTGAAPVVQTYTVSPSSRFTLYTNQVMVNRSFSMVVESSIPIVAERPMYFNYGGQTGGSDVIGYQPPGS